MDLKSDICIMVARDREDRGVGLCAGRTGVVLLCPASTAASVAPASWDVRVFALN